MKIPQNMQMHIKLFVTAVLFLLFSACKKDFAKKMTGTYKGSTKYFLRDSLSAIKDTILSESQVTIAQTDSRNIVKITITNPGLNEIVYREVSVSGNNLSYRPASFAGVTPHEIKGSITNNILTLLVIYRTTSPYTWTMEIDAIK